MHQEEQAIGTYHMSQSSDKGFQREILFILHGQLNGKTNTKRIGVAVSESLNGPWQRPDAPLFITRQYGRMGRSLHTNPACYRSQLDNTGCTINHGTPKSMMKLQGPYVAIENTVLLWQTNLRGLIKSMKGIRL